MPGTPRGDLQNTLHLFRPGYLGTLSRHFGNQDRNFVLSAVPIGWNPLQLQGMHIPDLLIAFNVDRAAIIEQWGYSIEDRGKPPDFVLETASAISPIWPELPELPEMPELPDLRKRPEIQARHTPNDHAERRNDYAAFGIPEYWRFDPTGGEYYETGLAGDRLVDGVYQPVTIVHTDETHHWGHSEVLNLDVCWEDEQLRFWDPLALQRSLRARPADQVRVPRVLRANPCEPQGLGQHVRVPVRLLHPQDHRVRVLDHPPVQVPSARYPLPPYPVPDALQPRVLPVLLLLHPPEPRQPPLDLPGPSFESPNSGPAPVTTPGST